MRPRSRVLLSLMLLAFLPRIWFGLSLHGLDQSSDEAHWDGWALHLMEEGLVKTGSSTFRPPLYPLFLAAVYTLFGHSYVAVRFFQALMGVATCLMIYALGRTLFDERAAWVSGMMGVVYPYFIFFSGVLMVETLFVLLVVLVGWLAFRMKRRSSWMGLVGLGVGLGLAVLCKPTALVFFLCVVIWYAVASREESKPWGEVLVRLGIVSVVMVGTILPWTIRNYRVSGHVVWVASNAGINLVVGSHPEATGVYDGYDYEGYVDRMAPGVEDQVERDRAALREGLRLLVGDPWRSIRLAWAKLLAFWGFYPEDAGRMEKWIGLCSYGPVLGLALWGMYVGRDRWRDGLLFYLFFAAFSLVHMVFFGHVRFRLPMDPFLIVLAGGGLVSVGEWIGR